MLTLLARLRQPDGYSVVELPLAIFMLGALMTYSVGSIHPGKILSLGRDAKRSGDAYQISIALELYHSDHGNYPTYLGLNPQASWEALRLALEPKYVQTLPVDPGSTIGYTYRYWSDGMTAKLYYYSETEKTQTERWNY